MKHKQLFGSLAAFVGLILCVALAVHFRTYLAHHPALWLLPIIGVVPNVSYKFPVLGFTPPTQLQMQGLGLVMAQVVMGDTDQQEVITHNFNLSAAQLAAGFPIVEINPTAGGAVFPQITIAKAANTVTLNKASATNTGFTGDVAILKPHTCMSGSQG